MALHLKNQRWLTPRVRDVSGALTLVCVPYAGGSANVFRDWVRGADEDLDVRALQVPGRGIRHKEAAISDLRELARKAAIGIAQETSGPVFLFGHSLGALTAFHIARELESASRCVRGLIVSACRAPADLAPSRTRLDELSDEALCAWLEKLGGTPSVVLGDASLMRLMLPSVRADLTALESYRATPDDGPLSCPVEAFAGTDDRRALPEVMGGWARCTRAGFTVTAFSGGHFFIREGPARVLGRVSGLVRSWSSRCDEERGTESTL